MTLILQRKTEKCSFLVKQQVKCVWRKLNPSTMSMSKFEVNGKTGLLKKFYADSSLNSIWSLTSKKNKTKQWIRLSLSGEYRKPWWIGVWRKSHDSHASPDTPVHRWEDKIIDVTCAPWSAWFPRLRLSPAFYNAESPHTMHLSHKPRTTCGKRPHLLLSYFDTPHMNHTHPLRCTTTQGFVSAPRL